MTWQLLGLAAATLVSEDLACIAAGLLIAQGKIGFLPGVLACLAGIFIGDLLLFLSGRLARRFGVLKKLVAQEKLERASAWLARRGAVVVLLSRFTPGLRLPTYFAAGLLRTATVWFALYLLLACSIWTPLLVGSTAVFGEQALRSSLDRGGLWARQGVALAGAAVAAALLARQLPGLLLSLRGRRMLHTERLTVQWSHAGCGSRQRRKKRPWLLIGFARRKVEWEFWPPWLAYLPLAPYLLFLAAKHRSLTLFTAANPGIRSGGFVGESKSEILDHLRGVEGAVAEYGVIRAGGESRLEQARRLLAKHGFDFPIVLKPDVGERGRGVAVILSEAEMERYLEKTNADTIIQRHVAGVEFGVFYHRYPGQPAGTISSITEKRFPEVMGDGSSTLEELILADARAACMAAAYRSASRRPLASVPARGERVRLVEIGSHCRGAIFLDAGHLKTPALEAAVDRMAQAHPAFYFGRFDVRAASVEAFQSGSFQVIELNGVSGEAAHVYDPAVSLREAYRVLYRHWRIAFEIGSRNRARGAAPMRLGELVKLCWSIRNSG
ncbi:MAG: hypothetical protein FJW37_03160 [Acidobacteria bacterium]|nr:hypothetical protein [Acidobacteriota bacterium]